MEILSRGWRTDLAILALSGSEIDQHPAYVVVRTPGNPGYRWGNFVLLRRAPSGQDLGPVEELFVRELPGIEHRAFGVDVPDGGPADLAAFADAGYQVEASVVLTASAVQPPPRPNTDAHYRPLAGDDDWGRRVALDLDCHGDDTTGYEDFARRKAAAERRLTEAGASTWYGAFDGDRLIATMGIVEVGDGTARLQEVQTHPEARGRGVAGSLVHAAGTDAVRRWGPLTLVTVAEPDYHAIRIYRSIGFRDAEVQLMAERL